MQAAIEEARRGLAEGGIPIGAVIVHRGRIIGRGHNRRVQNGSAILHGEMDAFENAGRQPATVYREAVLYTTLSPCVMCSGAILLYGIPRVVIGENHTFMGEEELLRARGVAVEVLQEPACIALMRDFIAQHPQLWNEDIGVGTEPALADEERRVAVEDGYRVWTRSVGGGAAAERPALLILHGGPGVPHDYLDGLAALAAPDRRVVFYDQLGCGRSDCPDEPGRWRLERFVAEIGRVREALGLDRVVLYGQSWGGMLAIEYALARPPGLAGLILANSTPSSALWGAEAARLRAELPAALRAILARHEAAGSTDHPDYQEAVWAYYRRHVLRIEPMPEHVRRSLEHIGQPYGVMWGPSEFHITGNLKDWDRSARLGEIAVPTLLISGEHDESTPAINRVMQQGIPGARWALLDGCSHLAHIEAPEAYLKALREFLAGL